MDDLNNSIPNCNVSGIKIGQEEIAELQRLEKSLYILYADFSRALAGVHELRSKLRQINFEVQYPKKETTVIDI
jgi:hypothetical protein